MKTIITIILLICTTLFISCGDRKNIIVTGQITDETTGQPIANAEVVVLCWYKVNIDDNSFNKQTVTTDKNGNYKAHFDKGSKVDVASKAKDYQPNRSYNPLSDNEVQINLKLSRTKSNPTLITSLNTDNSVLDATDKNLFLRIRIQGKDRNALDLNNIKTYGFNFSTLTTSTDTTQCDIWFKIEKKEGQPSILTTNKNGGLIPIYDNEIKSSLLYEKTTAPTTGYKTAYELKGNEEGFFILCKDGKTYGKIILEKSSVDISSPDGQGGFYKEFGKHFSCLYQPNGSTDFSYSSQTDINLEDFLVDYRMR